MNIFFSPTTTASTRLISINKDNLRCKLNFFYYFISKGVFLTVSRFHMHEVPVEERRGCQTPGNWSYIKLISTRRVIHV